MIKTDVVIIGAGPTGLFCAHQLGVIGLKCEIIDKLKIYKDTQNQRELFS